MGFKPTHERVECVPLYGATDPQFPEMPEHDSIGLPMEMVFAGR
jgi:hypothetical protein